MVWATRGVDAMAVVHATIHIAPDGAISGQAPPEVPAGQYDAPLTLPEQKPKAARKPLVLPVHDCGPWPEGFTMRREEIYGDDGR
jgi:hypothetical protein